MTSQQAKAIEKIVLSLNKLLLDFSDHPSHFTVTKNGKNAISAEIDCYFRDRAMAIAILLDKYAEVSFTIENEKIKII